MPHAGTAGRAKTVLVYRSELLNYSETFIKEQVLALHDWRAVLVGERRRAQGLDLGGMDIRIVGDNGSGAFEKVAQRVRRWMELPSRRIVDALVRERADLLHIHFATNAVRVWPSAAATGLPVLVTLHGYDINVFKEWWASGNDGWWMRRYPERLLKLARSPQVRFAAVSRAIFDRAVEYGIPAEKIDVRYIGVDTEKFYPGGEPVSRRARRVLFAGRLVEKKGCKLLVAAFADVQANVPDAELVVIGDGPERQECEALARRTNLNVRFLGVVPAEQIRQHMEQARVFCLPSITARNGDAEGLPIVVYEAQACGVPVVTSARGGATEGIESGVTGFSHREGDTAELARRLSQLLLDDDLADRQSDAARKRTVKLFDIRVCSAALEATYDALAVAG